MARLPGVKRALLVAAAMLALPASAAAKPYTQVSESAGVKATLAFDCKHRDLTDCKDFTLTIVRQSVELVSKEKLAPTDEAGTAPGDPPTRKSVLVASLDKSSEPEVVVDLYSGGAHCCFYSFIYRYSAGTGGYVRLKHTWGNPAYTLRDIGRDGLFEFVTGDDRFAYAYASFSESRFPIQIWRYRSGRLRDVTRRFPKQVRADARLLWRALPGYRRQHLDVRGLLAAYQADNYLLGRRQAARGWRRLRAMARRGQIKLPTGATGPSGARYLKSLSRFLRRLGYRH
jgi:hypothetical protein